MDSGILEAALGGIWRQQLRVDAVEPEDDFFRLGGDSLRAVHMLAAVEDAFGAPVDFAAFVESPTLADLGRLVAEARRTPARPKMVQPAGEESGIAPCTFAQERLWFVSQLTGNEGGYAMPFGARLRGPVDSDALERALQALVRRHAALRTTFAAQDGVPVQRIAAGGSLELVRREAGSVEEAQRLVDEAASRAFDLEHGPLAFAQLIRIADDDHVFQLVVDHIVCDGISLALIGRELAALYRGEELPAPRVQYHDFARRQRERLRGPELDAAVAKRADRLADLPAALDLPADRPRPPVQGVAGATRRLRLPPDTARAVREVARAEGATPFGVLLTTFAALLHRYSGQSTIGIGSTSAGRGRPELDDGVGLFANTVVLRADLSGEPSFREQLARMRDAVADAIAHEDVPFELLVAELQPERDPSRHPLFQVFFAHVPPTTLDLDGAEAFPARPHTSRVDLTVWFDETDQDFELVWEYSTDLFDEATVEQLERHYARLLDAALADPARPIATLPLVDAAERRALLERAGDPTAEFPVTCVHERFEAMVEQAPDAVAVSDENGSLTYGELNASANRLAHRLLSLGVGPETRVALFLERSCDLVAGVLGVLKSGGAYVPLDPDYPSERLAFVVEDAAAPVLVTQAHMVDRLPPHNCTVVCLEDLDDGPETNPGPRATPADLAYVIYTSGSTGMPKGVQVEHRQVARLFTATDAWYRFGRNDVWLLVHSYAFDVSVWELWGSLAHGGRLVVPSYWTTRSPEALAELVERERVTVFNATPSLFLTVMDELAGKELALRVVVFAGEELSPPTLRRWFERLGEDGPRLVNMYGITETTVHSTYREIVAADCASRMSSIGVPIPDLQTYVLDADLEPVPVGVPGEIFVGGAGVTRGYLNRPELTASRFLPNPFGPGRLYRSGDRARRTADGGLAFIGRSDDQVQIRGFRVEPGEVQAVLALHPAVAESAVVAVKGPSGDTQLAAYVVPAREAVGDDAALRRTLRAHLATRVPEFMVPPSLAVLDALPLTPNGKLDRRALPAPEMYEDAEFVAPQTPLEEQVAEVWRDLLGVEHVGRDDNFFHLGGHSLLAARAVTRLRELLTVELSVRALFEHPTLARFAAHVNDARGPAVLVIDAADERRAYPLSFQQQQLLFFDELTPGGATYNAALPVRIAGPLDHRALARALSMVVERHEALRTVLVWGDETPEQVVIDVPSIELPVVELAGEDDLQDALREHTRRPFDLQRDPMLRATLFRLADDDHVLLLQPHHVAVDGWSVDLLYSEIAEVYEATRAGRPASLPDLPLQYRDFTRWQHDQLAGERLAEQLEWWRTQLAGAPTDLPLPTDRPRPDIPSFEGRSRLFELPTDVADGVHRICRSEGATPYMVLMAAFATLVYRLGGRDDILLGGPIANRDRAEFEHMIGFLANTTVLRVRLAGNPRFTELVARVRDSAVAAYEHQHVPFEQIVEAVRPPRTPGMNPLFQINFRVRIGQQSELPLAGAATSRLPLDVGLARFDLALELQVEQDCISGELSYSTALFDAETIDLLALQFESLVRRLVDDPEARLLSVELPEAAVTTAGAPAIRRRREAPSAP